MKVIALVAAILIIILTGLVWQVFFSGRQSGLPPVPVPASPATNDAPLAATMAAKLEVPWSFDFLPDGSIILTERPGRIRIIDAQKGLLPEPMLTISDVAARGEGGLLGIALHPDFARNRFVYVYYTYQHNQGLFNRLVRFKENDRVLYDKTVIIDGIPGANNHNGGRIKFGPDDFLYITTGDAAASQLVQDIHSLAGKILRVEDDGTIPADNPFLDSPVYSLGHRNPQGLAWDNQGRLWATEHGSSATDELNLIIPGKNYGWPLIRGDETRQGLESPVIHSGGETWAPSGIAFSNGSLFFAGLRGQSVYEAALDSGTITLRRHFAKNFGRLRDIAIGPDNFIYILTNNRDGRGLPAAEDDQLIRINPEKL